jgi:hypothetical protein
MCEVREMVGSKRANDYISLLIHFQKHFERPREVVAPPRFSFRNSSQRRGIRGYSVRTGIYGNITRFDETEFRIQETEPHLDYPVSAWNRSDSCLASVGFDIYYEKILSFFRCPEESGDRGPRMVPELSGTVWNEL